MDARDADLSRGAGVAVRHHDRAALVSGGVERSTLRVQGVQDGEVAASGEPEERFDTTVDQHTSDRFGDPHGSGPPTKSHRRRLPRNACGSTEGQSVKMELVTRGPSSFFEPGPKSIVRTISQPGGPRNTRGSRPAIAPGGQNAVKLGL